MILSAEGPAENPVHSDLLVCLLILSRALSSRSHSFLESQSLGEKELRQRKAFFRWLMMKQWLPEGLR